MNCVTHTAYSQGYSHRISGPAGLSGRNPLDIEPYDHEMTPTGELWAIQQGSDKSLVRLPGETKIHVRATKYNCSHSSFAFRNVCKHTFAYEYLNFVGNGFESLGSLLFEYWAVLLSAMQYTVLFSLLH